MSQLENRDYVLILDKSGSMGTRDCNGKTRWEAARESTEAIASKVQGFDPDGITVIPFAGSSKQYDNTTADKVAQIFKENEPMGGTVLAPVLEKVFADYKKRKAAGQTKPNGEMLLVVTDGCPEDEAAVARSIVAFGNSLENADQEYGISFLQIGKDGGAAEFLRRLDDDLVKQGAKHDIVDAKTMEEVEQIGITAALVAALED